MKNILKSALLALVILLVMFLIPIYAIYNQFKTPIPEDGNSVYEYNKLVTDFFGSDVDNSIKSQVASIIKSGGVETRKDIITFLSISAYYIVIISLTFIFSGIYILRKNIKSFGKSLIFCGIISPVILAITAYVIDVSYL